MRAKRDLKDVFKTVVVGCTQIKYDSYSRQKGEYTSVRVQIGSEGQAPVFNNYITDIKEVRVIRRVLDRVEARIRGER